jgi:cystathionine beta-lyase
MDIETLVVQGISPEDNEVRAVVSPIYLTSTFAQAGLDEFGEFQYARATNPTRANLENVVAKLEGSTHALAFASGMAASAAFFALFKPGEKILINSNVYGGTYAYVKKILPQYGINYELVDDLNEVTEKDLTDDVKGIFIETPSTPLLRVTDIQRLSDLAHEKNIIVGIDNTFLTPYFQKVLDLGADVGIYSATKYFSGHADVIAGLITTSRDDLFEELKFQQINTGGILSPFDSYSLIRGIKTLSVRYDRQIENTKAILKFLLANEGVSKVFYAGSYSEREKQIQESQAKEIGAVLSFDLADGYDVDTFLKALNIFELAPSLGGVESLIEHVAKMSHQSFSVEERAKLGISDSTLRLAIGIESKNDLIEDLAQAFDRAKR